MDINAAIAVAVIDDHDYGLLVRPPELLEPIVDSLRVALISKVWVEITSGIQNGPVVCGADGVAAVRREVDAVVVGNPIDHHEAAVGRRQWREARRDEAELDGPYVASQLLRIGAQPRDFL